jgi:formiminotetrahydrofolate cyclodeaminase
LTLSHQRFTDLLASFQSPEPTPGGGSASALGGAVGAALLAMVAGLGKPRAQTNDETARLASAQVRCAALSDSLAALMDRDSDAYDLVVAAFRSPRSTDPERAARTLQIQEALRAATEAPLDVMRACAEAIGQAALVAVLGNRNASSDVRVGLELLGAGLRGARLNVEVNLASMKDPAFIAEVRTETDRLAAEAETGQAAAMAGLSRGARESV